MKRFVCFLELTSFFFFNRASKSESAVRKGFVRSFSAHYGVGAELMGGTVLPLPLPNTICFCFFVCGGKGTNENSFFSFDSSLVENFGLSRPLLNTFTLTLNKPLFSQRTYSSHISKHMNRFQETYPDWKEASGSQAAPFNFHSSSSPPSAPACSPAPLHL